jgi:hypothetical protein
MTEHLLGKGGTGTGNTPGSQRGRREDEEASRGKDPGAVTIGALIWTTQG